MIKEDVIAIAILQSENEEMRQLIKELVEGLYYLMPKAVLVPEERWQKIEELLTKAKAQL